MSAPPRPARAAAAGRWLAGLAVLALGVFAFGWRLGVETSNGDELVYRDAGAAYWRGDVTPNPEHPPLAKHLIGLGGLLGDGSLSAERVPAAVCGVLVAVVLFAVTRRLAGTWAGLLAALLWCALPLAPGVVPAHVARRATLEAPLLLFTTCAVLAAQRVADRSTPGRWAVLGLAVGAATASKLTGAAVAVVALAALWTHRRAWRAALPGAVLAGAVAVVVFCATYLPHGDRFGWGLRTVVAWQLEHAGRGAVQEVAGTVSAFPPWWSAWWFQAQYLGAAGTAVLWAAALLGAALVVRRRAGLPVVAALAATTAALVASPLKLPQYHDVAVPPLLVLAAVAVHALLTRPRAAAARLAGAVLVVVVLAPLATVAAGHLARVATTAPADYRVVARELPATTAPVVVWGDAQALGRLRPDLALTGAVAPDCAAAALVVDPTVANRVEGADTAAWVGACGWRLVLRADRLSVWAGR
ncbi:glycosyltransferase family 39 protein [Kineococcus terrestris]|uniref:glycosyltransferase family 39 protein n=1 Tax=Kineococcus terrestris TaxID=2044856 RepID=UPI0034DB032A